MKRVSDKNQPGRRERRRIETEEKLRHAARKLFRKHGFEGATMRDIADEADLALGTVYSHVRDKHALLELISQDDLARTEERAFATLGPRATARASVLHVFRCVYEHHAADKKLAKVIVAELTFARDPTAPARDARFLQFIARLAALLEQGQQRGELGAHFAPMAAAQLLFGVHFYVLIVWLSGALPVDDPMPAFEGSVDLILEGLKPQASKPSSGGTSRKKPSKGRTA